MAINCVFCGRFISFDNFVSWVPYGDCTMSEPPDEEFACLSCWEACDYKGLVDRVAWCKPHIVRNGRPSLEPNNPKRGLFWWYALRYRLHVTWVGVVVWFQTLPARLRNKYHSRDRRT